MYPKYSDTAHLTTLAFKLEQGRFKSPLFKFKCKCGKVLCLKFAGFVANNVEPDETPRSAASHQVLHCLLRHVCPNSYDIYGN